MPWYLAFAWRLGNTNWRTNRSRPSTTYALLAPAEMARSATPSRMEPPPTSTVRVTTSASCCSRNRATATDVSRPPEYASTTFFTSGDLRRERALVGSDGTCRCAPHDARHARRVH